MVRVYHVYVEVCVNLSYAKNANRFLIVFESFQDNRHGQPFISLTKFS